MVVQHNLTAMNSNRMLGVTTGAQAKTTEKLSSGYKINRAADDASGLAISEKMRRQIRGLTQASANAQDGISAVQTAEGALTEVHDMLQRMNELAVKSANGTESESDRSAIQAEIDQLTTEIDRVSETTKFNETYLLKGDKDAPKGYSFSYKAVNPATAGAASFTADAATSITGSVSIETTTALNQDSQNELIRALRDSGISLTAESKHDGTSESKKYSLELNGAAKETFDIVATDDDSFEIYDKNNQKLATIDASGYNKTASKKGEVFSASVVLNATSVTAATSTASQAQLYDRDGNKIAANQLDDYFTATSADDGTVTVKAKAGVPKVYDAVGNERKLQANEINAVRDKMGKLTVGLHVGADATTNNQIMMNIETMSAKGLGIAGLKVNGTDSSKALDAIDKIKAALTKVSAQRGDLGAIQNRLEHTIKNLDNVVENTTSAESAIRDTDMATTMVQYSNNNILSQAGTSMLAQANQSNQSVLSLLQ